MFRLFVGAALVFFGPILTARGSFDLATSLPGEVVFAAIVTLGGVALIGFGIRALRRQGRRAIARELLVNCGLASTVSFLLFFKAEATVEQVNSAPEEKLLYLPGDAQLRILAMGYRHALADLIWVRTVAYFGAHLVRGQRIDYLERYLNAVIALDPKFRRAYTWGGTIVMYNMLGIKRPSVEASTRIYEAGRRRFPNDWEFPFRIGVNYYFEIRTPDPEEQTQLRRLGARYIRESSLMPGAPFYLASLAARMYSKQGQADLARAHLEEVLVTVKDKRVRDYARARLAEFVKRAEDTSQIERPFDAIAREQDRTYPFMNLDQFLALRK